MINDLKPSHYIQKGNECIHANGFTFVFTDHAAERKTQRHFSTKVVEQLIAKGRRYAAADGCWAVVAPLAKPIVYDGEIKNFAVLIIKSWSPKMWNLLTMYWDKDVKKSFQPTPGAFAWQK